MPYPLGKLSPRHDDRTLQLSRYLTTGALPVPPPSVDWSSKLPRAKGSAPYGMMLNDRLGDCTCAAVGHAVQVMTANASHEVTVPDSAVLGAYEAVSGYDPVTGANDDGAAMLDVLNLWRKTGVGGHRILGYVKLSVGNWTQMQEAVALFGGVYLGWALPKSASKQLGKVWDVSKSGGKAGSWGGHATWGDGYGANGRTITWGADQDYTPAFYRAYCEEAYAVVSADWIGSNGLDPNRIDLATLSADLKLLTGAGL